ncbi:unnamed protein product [Cuscuta europaea]|uniref:Uncharacterized protein n=1 Tax=Cuscuta europaea TaxID=41803 RepID=A0A9P0ZL78_CUSEU|nr:unnamed protein product [Cuscuta europaea]
MDFDGFLYTKIFHHKSCRILQIPIACPAPLICLTNVHFPVQTYSAITVSPGLDMAIRMSKLRQLGCREIGAMSCFGEDWAMRRGRLYVSDSLWCLIVSGSFTNRFRKQAKLGHTLREGNWAAHFLAAA